MSSTMPMATPTPPASSTAHPLLLLVRYPMPVPGRLNEVYRRPRADTPARNPRPPTEYPSPDLLRFTLNGPTDIDFR